LELSLSNGAGGGGAAAADDDNVTTALKNVCSTSLPNEEMLFT